jgi:hypothetical protein
VAAAAQRAKIEGTPARRYIEAPRGRLDRLLDRFGLASVAASMPLPFSTPESTALQALSPWLGPVAGEAAALQELLALSRTADGAPAALAHCLCEPE